MREYQRQGVVIKVYHTDNGIFNTSKFMEELLKKQQNINFSGASASHQNGASERTINMVVTMASTMFMHDAMICHKYILSTDFFQQKWSILYGYKVGYLI